MSESVSYTIIEAVAEREEVSPTELTTSLFEAINPESLDTLFRDTTGHLTFEYHGYLVTVSHAGTVEVMQLGTA